MSERTWISGTFRAALVPTANGSPEIDALFSHDRRFAIHREFGEPAKTFVVSHVPTGMMICRANSEALAREAVVALEGFSVPWESSEPEAITAAGRADRVSCLWGNTPGKFFTRDWRVLWSVEIPLGPRT